MTKTKDFTTKTYYAPFTQTIEENGALVCIGNALSIIRNDDYCYLVDVYRSNSKVSKQSRRSRLMDKYNISSRESDSIVYANSDQLELVKRTTAENIQDWEKDIVKYTKLFNQQKGKNSSKRRYFAGMIETIQSRIERAKKKSPSCCFGGKTLQKRITQYPDDESARLDWDNKRLFLSFMGNANRSKGNDIIKYDTETGSVTASISEGLRVMSGLSSRKVVLGHARFKRGQNKINDSVNSNNATYYQFAWNTRKKQWFLHVSIRLTSVEQKRNRIEKVCNSPVKELTRTCGIDQNSGFLNATIIDEHGNPITNRRFEHSHSKEMSTLVSDLVTWCLCNDAGKIGVEALKGLNYKRRRSNNGGAGKNRVVSKIPFGEFKRRLVSTADTYGISVIEVNPAYTSRNTVQWSEPIFGLTTHDKASYLIARRALGLSINRRVHKQYPDGNGVSRRAFIAIDNPILRNVHDSNSLELCVVSYGS